MKMMILSTTFATVLAALPGAAPAQGGLGGSMGKLSGSGNSRDSIPPVVVQFSPAEGGKVELLEEDLSVMTRLLEKNLERGLGEDAVQYKMNIPLLVTSGGRSVRALYAEGMGALFMVKLNLPLLSPPKAETKKPQAATDSEWDQTRQEMETEDESSDLAGDITNSTYDEEKVDSLKTLILQTFKHASNIRSLRPTEFVAVSVFGTDPGGAALGNSVTVSSKGSSSKRKMGTISVVSPGPAGAVKEGANPPVAAPAGEAGFARQAAANAQIDVNPIRAGGGDASSTATSHEVFLEFGKRNYGRGTVLTLRVKKSDVDAFAKNEIDFDAFKRRVTLNSYYGNGYGVTSLNSWIQSGRSKTSNRP